MALARNLNKALYLSLEQSYREIELIQDSIAYLSAFKVNNDDIEDIWYYQKKADIVLGTGGKYQKSLFLSDVCVYTGDMDWGNIFSQSGFRVLGKQSINHGIYDVPVIVFSESLPFIDKNPKGMIILNLSESLSRQVIPVSGIKCFDDVLETLTSNEDIKSISLVETRLYRKKSKRYSTQYASSVDKAVQLGRSLFKPYYVREYIYAIAFSS
ncbi:MAG TPA: hypothetical protein GX727_07220, partial [Clostridium sp.]|nr:hypothetical protein [Clostridium sp.]